MPSKTAKLAKLDFKEKLIQSGKGGGQEALLKRLKVGYAAIAKLTPRLCTSSSRTSSRTGQTSSR